MLQVLADNVYERRSSHHGAAARDPTAESPMDIDQGMLGGAAGPSSSHHTSPPSMAEAQPPEADRYGIWHCKTLQCFGMRFPATLVELVCCCFAMPAQFINLSARLSTRRIAGQVFPLFVLGHAKEIACQLVTVRPHKPDFCISWSQSNAPIELSWNYT